MKMIGMVLVVACSCINIRAQIGLSSEDCNKAWNAIGSGQLDAEGNGTLRYQSRGTDVVLRFDQGLVFQAHYRKDRMTEQDINSLLTLNNNNVEWFPWTPPGIPPEDVVGSTWFRSDEAAVARLEGGLLKINGNRRSPAPAPTKVDRPEMPVATTPRTVPEPQKKKAVVSKKVTKPVMPDQLPLIGDSKTATIALLGEPNGIIESGDKEILVYGWGSVWMAENKVIQVN